MHVVISCNVCFMAFISFAVTSQIFLRLLRSPSVSIKLAAPLALAFLSDFESTLSVDLY